MTDDQTRPDHASDQDPTIALPGFDASPAAAMPGDSGVTQSAPPASTAVLPDPRIAPYLAAAERTLADLPPGERSELLEDLAAHLDEIAAEEGEALSTRLGPPAEYAAELRASAGYPAAGGGERNGLGQRALRLIREGWSGLLDWFHAIPGGPAVLSVLKRLRPAWWVFRGWLAAYLLVGDHLLVAMGFAGLQPFVALVACLALSVAWGLRTERRAGRRSLLERSALALVNAVAILVCLGGISGSGSLAYLGGTATSGGDATYLESSGLAMNGSQITNLTAYDLDGNPIEGFQLFDQNGYRVMVDTTQMWGPNGEWVFPLTSTDATGHSIDGTFPITYVMVTDYVDEATGTSSVQVSRVLTPVAGVVPNGLTGPVAPPIGSIVPMNADGVPDWARAQVPQATNSPSPSPEPTDDTSAGASDEASPSPSVADSTPTKKAKAKSKT